MKYLQYMAGTASPVEKAGETNKLQEVQQTEVPKMTLSMSRRQVDFSHPERCTQTRPVSCTVCGKAVVPDKQNWARLLVAITEHFIVEGIPKIALLSKCSLCSRDEAFPFLMDTKIDRYVCAKLSNDKWINLNLGIPVLVDRIGKLCKFCNTNLNDVIIKYEPKDKAHVEKAQMYIRPAYSEPAVQSPPTFASAAIKKVSDVLSAHFSNGYRLNSPIELVRFRSFVAENFGEEITLSDEELRSIIAVCGIAFDGKVYVVSIQTKEQIRKLAEEYFANGAQVIFFTEFYTKNENWLFEASVVSEEMLICILRSLFSKLSFTSTYFGYTDATVYSVLEHEILRVWGNDILLTYKQLAERLQYVPLNRIKVTLGQNSDFIWNSVETFSHISRIDITDDQRAAIRESAVRGCNVRGYVSVTDLPIGEIKERNYQLSITAVHNAVYRICLSDKFDKQGKIVTRKGDYFNALTIMKDYCCTVDKCSLDNLLTFEKELTGEIHRWVPMEAGNSVLIRVGKNAYVADKYVHFNVDAVDRAIGDFMKSVYLPLRAFTAFGIFPDCGQVWNLFLLESYCRRFSQNYRFDTLSVNSRNVGAVIRKSCGLSYTEIMTDAVVNSDIPLTDVAVGEFLYENGYISCINGLSEKVHFQVPRTC